jgi:hypothetical protein
MANRFKIEHEFDNEPTFIVDTEMGCAVAELSPNLSWQIREGLAKTIIEELHERTT